MPKLSGAHIRFDTHNDNKDFDTRLDVFIKNKTGIFLTQDLAEGTDLGHNTEFKDPSTYDFELALKSSPDLSDLMAPLVDIRIRPNGHDRWIFDYTATLTFDDGSAYSSTKSGVVLDQDNREHLSVFGA